MFWQPSLQLLGVCAFSITASLSSAKQTFVCEAAELCTCLVASGCNAVDKYLTDKRTKVCVSNTRSFVAKAGFRRLSFSGDGLKIEFREARPRFNDLDWYQAGATADRGLLNVRFHNAQDVSNFSLKEMAENSVNNMVWELTGQCKKVR